MQRQVAEVGDETPVHRRDGDAAVQKLSRLAYRTGFESDDAAYAELLEILIAAMTSTAGAPPELAQPERSVELVRNHP